MKLNIPVIYSQWDSRWASILLGFSTIATSNIYNYGCLITCLAIVARYFGKQVTPADINDKLKEKKGFKGNLYLWGFLTQVFPDIKEIKTETPDLLTDAQIGEIKGAIDSGYPVMVQIDVNPRTVEADMHFVLITGYNPSDENDFTIADPLGGLFRSLKDYLGWFRPSARKTIERYVIYEGKAQPPSAENETMPVPKKDFENLVHGSDQWDKTVDEYLPDGTDPKHTQFDVVQRVVSGFKSRVTDLENQLNEKNKDLAVANTEIDNQKDKIANIEKECQIQLKTQKDYYEGIIANTPNIEKLKGQYEGTIEDLNEELKEAKKQGGLKDLEIASLESELDKTQKSLGLLKSIFLLLKKLFKK